MKNKVALKDITIDIDADIRNQDWLKNESEMVVSDMVSKELEAEFLEEQAAKILKKKGRKHAAP